MIRCTRHAAVVLAMARIMTVMMPTQMITVFAANVRTAFSDPSATVGGKIKVDTKMTSSDSLVSVNVMPPRGSDILGSMDGINADGGVGAARIRGDAGTPNTGTLTFTLNFSAMMVGTSKIEATSQEIYDSNSQIATVNWQGSPTVMASVLQPASKGAVLKSLQISSGSLAPALSLDVDTYAMTVGTGVDRATVSVDRMDGNATRAVSGNEGSQMGENRVICRTTTWDGETIKGCVIVATKAEDGTSAVDASASFQVRMRIVEHVITIFPPDPEAKVPEGFKKSTINIDDHKVQDQVWGLEVEHQYCTVYGMNEAGEEGFYHYDMRDGERIIQHYSEDPAISGSVTKEVYDELVPVYDKIYDGYSPLRILLIMVVAITIILLVILLMALFTRGSGKEGGSRDELDDKKDDPRGGRGRNRREERAEEPELLEHPEGYQEYADEEGCQDSDWYDKPQEYEDDSAYGDDGDYRDLPEEDYPLDEESEDIYGEDEAVYEAEEELQTELPVRKSAKFGRPVQIQDRTPAQASASRWEIPVKQEQSIARRKIEQGPAEWDAQDNDFEISDLQ